jgi:hypothetical protein
MIFLTDDDCFFIQYLRNKELHKCKQYFEAIIIPSFYFKIENNGSLFRTTDIIRLPIYSMSQSACSERMIYDWQLIKYNAVDISQYYCSYAALKYRGNIGPYLNCVEDLLDHNYESLDALLTSTILRSDFEIFEIILSILNPNQEKINNLLLEAIKHGIILIKRLLEMGANPNFTVSKGDDYHISIPYMKCIMKNDIESLQLLIKHGLDIKNNSFRLLKYCGIYGKPKIFEYVLKNISHSNDDLLLTIKCLLQSIHSKSNDPFSLSKKQRYLWQEDSIKSQNDSCHA